MVSQRRAAVLITLVTALGFAFMGCQARRTAEAGVARFGDITSRCNRNPIGVHDLPALPGIVPSSSVASQVGQIDDPDCDGAVVLGRIADDHMPPDRRETGFYDSFFVELADPPGTRGWVNYGVSRGYSVHGDVAAIQRTWAELPGISPTPLSTGRARLVLRDITERRIGLGDVCPDAQDPGWLGDGRYQQYYHLLLENSGDGASALVIDVTIDRARTGERTSTSLYLLRPLEPGESITLGSLPSFSGGTIQVDDSVLTLPEIPPIRLECR